MRSRRAVQAGTALLAAAALALAAGCGGTGAAESQARRSSPTASPTANPTARPTSTPSPRAVVPPGWRVLTAKKAGLRFAVPKSWTKVDANELNAPESRRQLDELAESLGVTREQFRLMLKQIDVLAVSATFTPDTYGEVQVIPFPMLAEIPSREALRAQLSGTTIDIRGFKDLATPVGRALLGASRRVIDGEVGYSDTLIVQVDNGVAGLTVSASTAERCRALTLKIVRSLRDIGKGAAGPGSTIDS